MKNEIIEVLNDVKAGVDYVKEEKLITDGILTSFDIIMLVSLLNNKFNVEIGVMDLVPENFESVSTIESLINKVIKDDHTNSKYLIINSILIFRIKS